MNKLIKKLFLSTSLVFGINLISTNIVHAETIKEPNIIAKSAITIDINSGEIIYSKNADAHAEPASITKLMSALLLTEHKQKTDAIPFTKLASEQESSSVYVDKMPNLKVNDTFTAENVMKGLLLPSGNDMAMMIAESIGGSVTKFQELMNQKAKELGMNNTHFVTPNGLDDDEHLHGQQHYSTASDLAILGRAAYNDPWIKQTMALKDNVPISTTKGYTATLNNTNRNLNLNGCVGGKTGFTDKAGRCLIAMYERDGRAILGVVLGSDIQNNQNMSFKDMESIINYSYSYKKDAKFNKNAEVGNTTLNFKPLRILGATSKYTVPLTLRDDIEIYKNKINDSEVSSTIEYSDVDTWNLTKDTVLAKLIVKERFKTTTYNLYSNIDTKTLVNKHKTLYIVVTLLLCIITFFVTAFINRYRKRRRRIKLLEQRRRAMARMRA